MMKWSFLLFLAIPQVLFADGGFIPPPDWEIWGSNQVATLMHSASFEELSVIVRFEGNTSDFAWIIPVPSEPAVDSVSLEVFNELAYLSAPVRRERGMQCGCGGRAYDRSQDGVEVVGEGTVGFLEYVILHATDPGVLRDSLESWGYEYPEQAESLFRYYIEKDWEYFVAARVDSSEVEGWSGHYYGYLQPVKLTFQSPEPVYPMKMSSISSREADVILYVVAEHRMTFDGATLRYADRITDEELDLIGDQYPHLVQLFQGPRFLTKLERRFDEEEMEDITLKRAPDDQEYREITFSGIVGDGLVFASLLFLFALWSTRRRKLNRIISHTCRGV